MISSVCELQSVDRLIDRLSFALGVSIGKKQAHSTNNGNSNANASSTSTAEKRKGGSVAASGSSKVAKNNKTYVFVIIFVSVKRACIHL